MQELHTALMKFSNKGLNILEYARYMQMTVPDIPVDVRLDSCVSYKM